RGPSHVQNVLQSIQLDRSIDAEIGACTFRQCAIESDVDLHGSIDRTGIDAYHVAGNYSVTRIDRGDLPDLDVLCLRLGNVEHRLQPARLRDLREIGSGEHVLTRLER